MSHARKLVYLPLVALPAALLALWFGRLPYPRFKSAVSSSLREQLAEALGPVRPLRGRLSGSFDHALYTGPIVVERVQDLKEAGKILRAARSPSPRTLADLAVVQLLAGEREKACVTLETAARGSHDAKILSDLAAVLLDTLPPSEKIRAFDIARQAVEADPNLLEARCNLALALDDFGLVSQAREAWSRCQKESGLGWSGEAEERLRLLERPPEDEAWKQALPLVEAAAARGDVGIVNRIASRLRQRARLHGEEVALPAWAAEFLAGHSVEASRHLQVARVVAEALRGIHRDSLLADAVAAIDEAQTQGDRSRLQELAKGHAGYLRGLDLFQERRSEDAVAELEQAANTLGQARSPFRGWVIFRAQLCRYLAGTPGEEILEVLQALGSELDPSRHPILAARRLTLIGMTNARLAHFADSSHFYQGALHIFERIGEREHMGSLHYMLGENHRIQGEMEAAWGRYLQAFPLLRDIGWSVFFQNTLMEAANASLRQGFPGTSLLFHEEMVRMAKARVDEDPIGISEALLRRSRAYRALGETEKARRDLDESLAHAERIAAGQWRDRLLAELNLALGELELEGDPRRALEHLDVALEANLRSQMRHRLPALYETRARALRAVGKSELARDDLERGISEAEAQRSNVLADPKGASAFEQARSLFDSIVELESRLGNPAVAFEYAERARARTLLEMVDSGGEAGARVPAVEEVQREVPAGTALVELAVLEDQTLAWVLTRESFDLVQLQAGEERLRTLVGNLRSAVIAGKDARQPAKELYRLLIQPLNSSITARDLIVVPDRSLHLLPFAALINPATGRYLVEERAVAKAPSATLWAKALQQDRRLSQGKLAGMLVIGDPNFDHDLFPVLTSLSGAREESLKVAAIHPGSQLLVDERATKRAFLTEAPLSSIVHVATHARSSRENPLVSALLLAREGDDPGVLYAHEIYRMRFVGTRLVVLSGCGTSEGQVSASEGVGSLARAFLGAGVPAVVGSLWDTKDKAARDVLISFHRRLSQGEDASSALRGAQLAALRRSNPEAPRPDLWAGFELIGGVSPR